MTKRSQISGVLLAAGASSRLQGSVPKQLVDFGGRPLVRRVAEEALRSRLAEVLVVTGSGADRVGAALEGLDVRLVHNALWREGQSGSVAVGLGALAAESAAACFIPCDQPFLDAETIDRILGSFQPDGAAIVVPRTARRRGAPVVFARRFFPELLALEGDEGGRRLLTRHALEVFEVELPDERPLLDVDTEQDLEHLRALL